MINIPISVFEQYDFSSLFMMKCTFNQFEQTIETDFGFITESICLSIDNDYCIWNCNEISRN
jgi:hypothetical protein